MKVKMIYSLQESEFEKEINAFIKDKKVIDIKFSFVAINNEYFRGVPTKCVFANKAMVLYED